MSAAPSAPAETAPAPAETAPAPAGPALPARTELALAGFALLAIIALQFPLIWQRALNWDELYHYWQIQRLRDGSLVSPLQTYYTRLFNWLYDLPGNSIDHIVTGRFVMFGFELLTLAGIYGVARQFFDRTTALLCAAAYLGAGFVFQHGFSFRADPIAAGLLMTALWLILATDLRGWKLLALGGVLGLAAMITIKIVLYAPAFAGVAWLAWSRDGRSRGWLVRVMASGAVAALTFAALYAWHAHSLHGPVAAKAQSTISSSAENMFFLGVPTYLVFMLKEVALAPVFTILLAMAPLRIFADRWTRDERIALAGLAAPILTLAFYHNTAPYYYVFILAPVAIAVGASLNWLRGKIGVVALAAAVVIGAVMLWIREDSSAIRQQHLIVDTMTRTFPQPVAYFDFCGFLGRFPKANGYMTPWGLITYGKGGMPGYREQMERITVPLVMNNDPMFDRLFAGQYAPEFKPEDAAALRASYVPFWGPFLIAGQNLAAGETREVDLLVPGTYTVRDGTVVVDGSRLTPGQTIALERGKHRFAAPGAAARLTWGAHLDPPATPPPGTPFWTPF